MKMREDANYFANWSTWDPQKCNSRNYLCAYCNTSVSSDKGLGKKHRSLEGFIYFCPVCSAPTMFLPYSGQLPKPGFGENVPNLPVDIQKIYDEIRTSHLNEAFTASILLSRKLIMHLAVNKCQIKDGLPFASYIDELSSRGYLPPTATNAMDKLRKMGNLQNHELQLGTIEDSSFVVHFITLLLRVLFEYDIST